MKIYNLIMIYVAIFLVALLCKAEDNVETILLTLITIGVIVCQIIHNVEMVESNRP